MTELCIQTSSAQKTHCNTMLLAGLAVPLKSSIGNSTHHEASSGFDRATRTVYSACKMQRFDRYPGLACGVCRLAKGGMPRPWYLPGCREGFEGLEGMWYKLALRALECER